MRRFGWLSSRQPSPDEPSPDESTAPATARVEELLSRYAADHLSPTPRQLDGVRAAMLEAYAVRAGQARRRVVPRRLALVGALAALLATGGTLAANQSGPGEPLYRLRLAIESLTLPAQGATRADALLSQLELRLAEAREESRRHNESGLADAVGAYLETLAELSGEVGESVSDSAINDGLQRHVDTLRAILDDAPAPAQTGIQEALDQAEQAQQAIEDRPSEGSPEGSGEGSPPSSGPPVPPGPPGSPGRRP